MTEIRHATIEPEVLGIGETYQWVAGQYDEIPLHVRLTASLLARLRDGDQIAAERLDALTTLVTAKIHGGEGRLGRQWPEGRGMMMLAVDLAAWEEAISSAA